MATVEIDFKRSDQLGDMATAVGEAITNEVNVTYQDTLTKEEIVLALEKAKLFILKAPAP